MFCPELSNPYTTKGYTVSHCCLGSTLKWRTQQAEISFAQTVQESRAHHAAQALNILPGDALAEARAQQPPRKVGGSSRSFKGTRNSGIYKLKKLCCSSIVVLVVVVGPQHYSSSLYMCSRWCCCILHGRLCVCLGCGCVWICIWRVCVCFCLFLFVIDSQVRRIDDLVSLQTLAAEIGGGQVPPPFGSLHSETFALGVVPLYSTCSVHLSFACMLVYMLTSRCYLRTILLSFNLCHCFIGIAFVWASVGCSRPGHTPRRESISQHLHVWTTWWWEPMKHIDCVTSVALVDAQRCGAGDDGFADALGAARLPASRRLGLALLHEGFHQEQEFVVGQGRAWSVGSDSCGWLDAVDSCGWHDVHMYVNSHKMVGFRWILSNLP